MRISNELCISNVHNGRACYGIRIPRYTTSCSVRLVYVSEIQILAIGHIGKSRRVQVTALQTSIHFGLDLVPSPVFAAHENPESRDDADLEQVGHDH